MACPKIDKDFAGPALAMLIKGTPQIGLLNLCILHNQL